MEKLLTRGLEDTLIHYIDYIIDHYKGIFADWLSRPVMELVGGISDA